MKITYSEQVEKWVQGESIHLGDIDDPMSRCCPDFSCCCPEIQTPREVRERFARAYREDDDATMYQMLGMFLGTLVSVKYPEKGIHIAGDDPTEH